MLVFLNYNYLILNNHYDRHNWLQPSFGIIRTIIFANTQNNFNRLKTSAGGCSYWKYIRTITKHIFNKKKTEILNNKWIIICMSIWFSSIIYVYESSEISINLNFSQFSNIYESTYLIGLIFSFLEKRLMNKCKLSSIMKIMNLFFYNCSVSKTLVQQLLS